MRHHGKGVVNTGKDKTRPLSPHLNVILVLFNGSLCLGVVLLLRFYR